MQQSARNAAASAKETAANMAASAKSGGEKTKATMQEKGERMAARDPLQKEMATEKKEHRINQAELNKQEAHELNAANKQAAAAHGTGTGTHSYPTTGMHDQMSAMPGHGTGEPAGQVTEGVVGFHPIGTNTDTGTTTAGQNTGVGGGTNTGYGAFR